MSEVPYDINERVHQLQEVQERTLKCLEERDTKLSRASQARQEYHVNTQLITTWLEKIEKMMERPIDNVAQQKLEQQVCNYRRL